MYLYLGDIDAQLNLNQPFNSSSRPGIKGGAHSIAPDQTIKVTHPV